jgi:chromosome segregation ATPase
MAVSQRIQLIALLAPDLALHEDDVARHQIFGRDRNPSPVAHDDRLERQHVPDRVERARQFLRQRQEEAEQMKARIQIAHASSRELKRWLQSVDMEEAVVRTQLARLKEELSDLLPVLELEEAEAPRAEAEIVSFHRLPAE